jgi:hypothetical protein
MQPFFFLALRDYLHATGRISVIAGVFRMPKFHYPSRRAGAAWLSQTSRG